MDACKVISQFLPFILTNRAVVLCDFSVTEMQRSFHYVDSMYLFTSGEIILHFNFVYIFTAQFIGLFILHIFFKILFIFYLWLCWVFISVQGLSLVAASGGHSSLWCARSSLSRPLLLRSTGSRGAGSVIVAHRPSCSVACGIFPDQGLNPCPLHWQADS